MEYVYCAVWTDGLNIIHVNAVTAEDRVRSQFSEYEIYGGRGDNGRAFLQVLGFSLANIIPVMLHTHLHVHVALTRRTKERSLGTFQKTKALSEIGEQWIARYFHSRLKGLSRLRHWLPLRELI
jgi:hypothetical protein